MVKRIVDTKFWTSMDVIDKYSVEDKFFALYLMTNGKTTQVGIYSLPKKIISFETGFTTEVIQVLLERFSTEYGQILYSESTQEITLLKSLEYTILKGGKPVSDLLERELRVVQDGQLILSTYQAMLEFWEMSKRKFDQTIKEIFERELINRELIVLENDQRKRKEIQKQESSYNPDENLNPMKQRPNQSVISSKNQDSKGLTLINDASLLPEEQVHLGKYLDYLKFKKPSFNQQVKASEITYLFYKELLGAVNADVKEKIAGWEKQLPKSLILEAFIRSIDKFNPLSYVTSIINSWLNAEVKNLRDVIKLDREFIHGPNK